VAMRVRGASAPHGSIRGPSPPFGGDVRGEGKGGLAAGSAASLYPAVDLGVILNRHTSEPLTADCRSSTVTGLSSTSSQNVRTNAFEQWQ